MCAGRAKLWTSACRNRSRASIVRKAACGSAGDLRRPMPTVTGRSGGGHGATPMGSGSRGRDRGDDDASRRAGSSGRFAPGVRDQPGRGPGRVTRRGGGRRTRGRWGGDGSTSDRLRGLGRRPLRSCCRSRGTSWRPSRHTRRAGAGVRQRDLRHGRGAAVGVRGDTAGRPVVARRARRLRSACRPDRHRRQSGAGSRRSHRAPGQGRRWSRHRRLHRPVRGRQLRRQLRTRHVHGGSHRRHGDGFGRRLRRCRSRRADRLGQGRRPRRRHRREPPARGHPVGRFVQGRLRDPCPQPVAGHRQHRQLCPRPAQLRRPARLAVRHRGRRVGGQQWAGCRHDQQAG